jgi:hypothetical protein
MSSCNSDQTLLRINFKTEPKGAAQKRTPAIADPVCQSEKKPNGIKGCAGACVSV